MKQSIAFFIAESRGGPWRLTGRRMCRCPGTPSRHFPLSQCPAIYQK